MVNNPCAMSRREITTSPFPNPSPKIACSSLVSGMSELTRIVERSIRRSLPIAVSSAVAFSPCNHSNPEMNAVPDATTFISGLEWLHGEDATENEAAIGRLLLIDRSTILVSSLMPGTKEEQAIFGEGFGNGLVVIARRLMAQGLLTARDPRQ